MSAQANGTGLRVLVVCLLTVGIAAVAAFYGLPGRLPAKDLTTYGSVLATLLFASVILERALDVWLSITMGAKADHLDAEIRALKIKIAAGPPAGTTSDEATLKRTLDDRTEHGSRTRTRALPMAVVAGLAISSVGVRSLNPLFGPEVPAGRAFVFIDVLVTGMLLAGGSDGVHWIVALYRDWVDKNRSTKS